MGHLLSSILLALSSNVDNLGVGVAYGVRRRHVRLRHNLLVAGVTGAGTLAAVAFGEWVNDFMSEEAANLVGAAVLVALGVSTLAQALRGGAAAGTGSRHAAGGATGGREALALALSLTLNNLGAGIGGGISHLDLVLTTALTALTSVAALAGGEALGRRMTGSLPAPALGVAAGALLVALGVVEVFF
ncbi:MAG: manganese efflux pump [Anaeromyxobacter sp.]